MNQRGRRNQRGRGATQPGVKREEGPFHDDGYEEKSRDCAKRDIGVATGGRSGLQRAEVRGAEADIGEGPEEQEEGQQESRVSDPLTGEAQARGDVGGRPLGRRQLDGRVGRDPDELPTEKEEHQVFGEEAEQGASHQQIEASEKTPGSAGVLSEAGVRVDDQSDEGRNDAERNGKCIGCEREVDGEEIAGVDPGIDEIPEGGSARSADELSESQQSESTTGDDGRHGDRRGALGEGRASREEKEREVKAGAQQGEQGNPAQEGSV